MSNTKESLDLVSVVLIDEDKNVPLNKSVIASFKDIVIKSGEDPELTLLKLAVNENIKGILEKHNDVRKGIINETTLERTGKKVQLSAITIEDVTVKIR